MSLKMRSEINTCRRKGSNWLIVFTALFVIDLALTFTDIKFYYGGRNDLIHNTLLFAMFATALNSQRLLVKAEAFEEVLEEER